MDLGILKYRGDTVLIGFLYQFRTWKNILKRLYLKGKKQYL